MTHEHRTTVKPDEVGGPEHDRTLPDARSVPVVEEVGDRTRDRLLDSDDVADSMADDQNSAPGSG